MITEISDLHVGFGTKAWYSYLSPALVHPARAGLARHCLSQTATPNAADQWLSTASAKRREPNLILPRSALVLYKQLVKSL